MSRSSSVSIKDKPKKSRAPKQRRDDSEGFDVRSAYTPFYPQAQHPGWAPTAQFAPMASQYNMSMQINYQGQPQPPFGPPPQPMYPSMMPVGSMQPYGPMSQVSKLSMHDGRPLTIAKAISGTANAIWSGSAAIYSAPTAL